MSGAKKTFAGLSPEIFPADEHGSDAQDLGKILKTEACSQQSGSVLFPQ